MRWDANAVRGECRTTCDRRALRAGAWPAALSQLRRSRCWLSCRGEAATPEGSTAQVRARGETSAAIAR